MVHTRTEPFYQVTNPFDLIPADAEIQASHGHADNITAVLASTDDCLMLVEFNRLDEFCRVTVAGVTVAAVDACLNHLLGSVPHTPPPDESWVDAEFWCRAGSGFAHPHRRVHCPSWTEIARNYPGAVRSGLTRLFDAGPPGEFDGRLLLWHGPPGTGKTTALRSLMRAWGTWATFDYIVDGSGFLRDPSYLVEVALRANVRRPGERYGEGSWWRAVLVEDAGDAFLTASGSDAIGMLLNVTDGILAQGAQVVFLVTTNERVSRFNSAVTRPGRVWSIVEFSEFSPSEARKWLQGPPSEVRSSYTLSELYADKRGVKAQSVTSQAGLYL